MIVGFYFLTREGENKIQPPLGKFLQWTTTTTKEDAYTFIPCGFLFNISEQWTYGRYYQRWCICGHAYQHPPESRAAPKPASFMLWKLMETATQPAPWPNNMECSSFQRSAHI